MAVSCRKGCVVIANDLNPDAACFAKKNAALSLGHHVGGLLLELRGFPPLQFADCDTTMQCRL